MQQFHLLSLCSFDCLFVCFCIRPIYIRQISCSAIVIKWGRENTEGDPPRRFSRFSCIASPTPPAPFLSLPTQQWYSLVWWLNKVSTPLDGYARTRSGSYEMTHFLSWSSCECCKLQPLNIPMLHRPITRKPRSDICTTNSASQPLTQITSSTAVS